MIDAVSGWFSALIKILCTQKGYYSLFKAGIFLAAGLFTSSQVVFTYAFPYEKEAMALMHKVEVELKVEYDSPKELTCSLEQVKIVYENCKNSKYSYNLSSSLLDALSSWTELLLLGCVDLCMKFTQKLYF
ncbi:MAG: hypothetical protein RPR97_00975 [Colwellia sp.]